MNIGIIEHSQRSFYCKLHIRLTEEGAKSGFGQHGHFIVHTGGEEPAEPEKHTTNDLTVSADGDGKKGSSHSLIPAIEGSHNVLSVQIWEETKREDTE